LTKATSLSPYPLQAIRELLLNAVVHKDYRDNTDEIVKIFDDSIEISNPSNFYGNITLEDLDTDSYKPKHRNRLLIEMFYLMGAIEKYGTGIMRVKKWMLDYPELTFTIQSRSGSIVASLALNNVGMMSAIMSVMN
jgi:ATP-dependent DNA helicase RecG